MKINLAVLSLCMIPFLSMAAVDKNDVKPISNWTCEDFIALDDSYKPTAIGFAEAINNKEKPEEAILDINGIERITPILIQDCMKDKKESFLKKIEERTDKIKREL